MKQFKNKLCVVLNKDGKPINKWSDKKNLVRYQQIDFNNF
jgi:hypothetical protein